MNNELINSFICIDQEITCQLDNVKDLIVKAFDDEEFSKIKEYAVQAEKFKELNEKLDYIKEQLIKIHPDKKIEKEFSIAGRATRGERTPQVEYRIPILKALSQNGGSGETKSIIDSVYPLMKDKLNKIDMEFVPARNEIRWRNVSMWERYSMVQDGLLSNKSKKGVWEITEKGYKYLSENDK